MSTLTNLEEIHIQLVNLHSRIRSNRHLDQTITRDLNVVMNDVTNLIDVQRKHSPKSTKKSNTPLVNTDSIPAPYPEHLLS